MKRCSKCGSEKDSKSSYCKPCRAEYYREYTRRNPEYVQRKIRANRESIREKRQAIWEYKSGLSCVDCGILDPIVLDFDHIHNNKSFNIAEAIRLGYSLERIFAEIEKCEPVCANCHRRRTHTRKMI